MIGAPLKALDMVKPGVRSVTARQCFVSSDLPAMSQLGKSLGAQDDIGVREFAAPVSGILHQFSDHEIAMVRLGSASCSASKSTS